MKKNYDYKRITAELKKDPLHTLNNAFALMFVIPMLIVLYLIIGKYKLYNIITGENSILWIICIILSLGGFFSAYIMIKQAMLRMLRYSVECRNSDEMKTALVSEVSHDFRTPLTTLKISIDTLRHMISGMLSEKHREILDLCSSAIEKLTHFVSTMLDASRLKLTKVSMKRERVDFCALIKDELNMIMPQTAQKMQKILYEKTDKSITIWGDIMKLRQVVSNLLSNAVKYTKENGEIKITLKDINGTARLDIINTGIGISEDKIDKIFDKYYQIDSNSKDGVGLGLSIVKEIVQMHKGRIEASSRLGEETQFSVFLPQDLRTLHR
jgi:signal transduction histidine kinase